MGWPRVLVFLGLPQVLARKVCILGNLPVPGEPGWSVTVPTEPPLCKHPNPFVAREELFIRLLTVVLGQRQCHLLGASSKGRPSGRTQPC